MPKPLKRFPALQPISRQHHKVLQFCFKIRQGLAKGIAPQRVLDYAHYFWKDYYTLHTKHQIDSLSHVLSAGQLVAFKEKEDQLFVLYKNLKPFAKNLVDFEKALYAHVRWEERVLFEVIQENHESAQLETLIPKTSSLADWCEVYEDQFWV